MGKFKGDKISLGLAVLWTALAITVLGTSVKLFAVVYAVMAAVRWHCYYRSLK